MKVISKHPDETPLARNLNLWLEMDWSIFVGFI